MRKRQYLRAERRLFVKVTLAEETVLAGCDDAGALNAHTAWTSDHAARHVRVVGAVGCFNGLVADLTRAHIKHVNYVISQALKLKLSDHRCREPTRNRTEA